jgi:hypothetical protein
MKKQFIFSGLLCLALSLSACPTTGVPGGANTPADGSSTGNNTNTGGSTGGNASVGGSASISKAQYVQMLQCLASKNTQMTAVVNAQIAAINAIPESSWATVAANAEYQAYIQQASAAACAPGA